MRAVGVEDALHSACIVAPSGLRRPRATAVRAPRHTPGRALAFIVCVLVAWAVEPSATSGATTTTTHALAEAKSFRVEVEQSFGEAGEIELPFSLAATELLQFAGLNLVTADTADVVVRIHAEGRALSKDYADDRYDGALRTHFSGAELTGWFQMETTPGTTGRTDFTGSKIPPMIIHEAYDDVQSAPFLEPFGAFVEAFTAFVAREFGPTAMMAVLRAPDGGEFFYAVPQAQLYAAIELGRRGDADALPVLLEALTSFSAHRQAGAACGLLAAGNGSVLPELIAVLNTNEGELDEMESDGRWSTITDMESAFESRDNGGFLDAWPEILKAIRDLPSPEKTTLLTAALQDTEAVTRRIGAALLLGHCGGHAAVDPLLHTAKYDPNDLVRTAAINALGALREKRAVSFLRAVARKPDESPDKSAAINALYAIDPAQVPKEAIPPEESPPEEAASEEPAAGGPATESSP